MKDFKMNSAWRTPTVVALCQGMRETQDFGALPILADALQEAGCPEGEGILALMRRGGLKYTEAAPLVACVWSDEGEEAVEWLKDFGRDGNGPHFDTLFAAASGHHEENSDRDYPGYCYSENDGGYLHFNGTDAHGEIPAGFWDKVQLVCGKPIPGSERAERFSCSC